MQGGRLSGASDARGLPLRTKRAVGRRKDLIEVDVLGALREEIDAGR